MKGTLSLVMIADLGKMQQLTQNKEWSKTNTDL